MKKHAKKIIPLLLVVAMLIPTVGMIFSSAADNKFPVELAYNNLFVFDKWANNQLSTTIMPNDTTNPYGKVESNITEGSTTITLLRNAPDDFGGIFTAYAGDTKDAENNQNYYEVDVKPNTTYTFSYNLTSSNLSSFVPYVFYFDDKNLALPDLSQPTYGDGLYPGLGSLSLAGNLNGDNTWNFTTPTDADRIQIRFTLGNSADGNASTATLKNIIIYESELTEPENIFDFNEWASNDNSNGVAEDYSLANGTADISDGSIYFEATGGLFTNFIIYGNCDGYYTMPVKPYTAYSVSYELINSTLVDAGVAIAWHKADGTFIDSHNLYAYNNNGLNEHTINTPAEAAYMQVAFGAFHTGEPGSGTMKNIRFSDTGSLFCLGEWAANPYSNFVPGGSEFNADAKNNTVTFTSKTHGNAYFTNYGDLTSCANFYWVDVEPGTTYTFSYNLAISNASGPIYFQPYFAEFTENDTSAGLHNYISAAFGKNQYTFTTGATTSRVMVVFSFHHTDPEKTTGDCTWTVKDMTLCPAQSFEDITGAPHRQAFTYDHSKADSSFYGELPEAIAPEGYVFGGWYTGENGTGERITPETKIKFESFSVFPKFELAVDSLELATMPTKTTYTVGEKFNPAGLSLKATVGGSSFIINSDIYCTPAYLETAGTQTITAHYGGKTVTFTVDVLASNQAEVYINGTKKIVDVTNGNYLLNAQVSDFNRYTITYYSDSYVQGFIAFPGGLIEEFFLEPSDNGTFTSLIDNYLNDTYHDEIQTIKFTCLDNELGTFQLKTVTTDVKEVPNDHVIYHVNGKYELGVDILNGGVVSDLYVNDKDPITARVYNTTFDDKSGNGAVSKTITKVDYESKLDELNLSNENLTATNQESQRVNLINTLDRGRYLQQSYYGTNKKPYIQGQFNGSKWRYNPVQGGNVGEEPSKVIDYEITDTYIYVKARPMEWEKWSDKHSANCNHIVSVMENGQIVQKEAHSEKLYGNDVVSDTYVEAWYTFENGMIKVRNRKVDYSGLPEAYAEQEMPALYLIEPLNHFVYNNVSKESAWENSYKESVNLNTIKNIEEPEFWGIVDSYHEYHYVTRDAKNEITSVVNDSNNDKRYDLFVEPQENWAAFTASEDEDSFGVGIYSEASTQFFYGVMPQKYASAYDVYGNVVGNSKNLNFRHAETINPTIEDDTSYIAPLAKMWFRSYEPTEYTYYLATGTSEEIRGSFSLIGSAVAETELAKSKIAVPETVYMNPANNLNGQYYVNNIMDENNFYNVKTVAEREDTDMYFGLHVKDAVSYSVNVTNVTDSANDIILGNGNGTGNLEGQTFSFDDSEVDSVIKNGDYSLRFTNAVETNKTATAKWEITVTFKDGSTETFTAYTVLYTPMRTVGAVAESRRNSNVNNEISTWITGANGVDHEQRSPLGAFKGDIHDSGYFKADPLYSGVPTSGGSSETSDDYIVTTDKTIYGKPGENETDDYSENAYVLQTATHQEDSSRAQSYLGLLMVDSSRYTNTNQIPNFKLGYDYLRVGSESNNSSDEYNTYYTLGTSDSFTAGATSNGDNMGQKPSGWTSIESYGRGEVSVPSRKTLIPDYDVSTINGKYIHALGWAECRTNLFSRWATAGTSVLCSVTDKSALREAVLNAYVQADKIQDTEFIEKLQNAATVLGTPSASQAEIDTARKELNEDLTTLYYTLKYDNLFSAYEFSQKTDGLKMVDAQATKDNKDVAVLDEHATVRYQNNTIIINSNNTDASAANVYTYFGPLDNYYNIPVTGGTEYVFEYYVDTTAGAQAHVFFYDANGEEAVLSTRPTATGTNTEASPNSAEPLLTFAGAYTNGKANTRVIVRVTAPANAVKAAFRFGNILDNTSKSTFSNIRFVEAKHYSEEIVYSTTKAIYTEDLYAEYTPYGTLMSPARIGFDFIEWRYDDETTVVNTSDLATANTTIYSMWYEHSYKIAYKANGGTGSETTTQLNKYTANVTLQNGGFTRTDYILKGWSTNPDATVPDYNLGQTVSRLHPVDNATVTLYAVWVLDTVNITFDNLIDIKAWNATMTPGNAVVSNVTETGFTLTSTHPNGGEGTYSSPFFTVEPGKKYKIEMETTGSPWDVYIFFCDKDGNWVDFVDGQSNRFSSYTTWDPVFTAPNKDSVVKAQIRVDANEPANPVTFNNIRVYEYSRGEIDVTPANKQVVLGDAFGTLPTPTREGYVFAGWYDGTTLYTSESKATERKTYNLKSDWVKNEDVLTEDMIVVDFGTSINLAPLSNDTELVNKIAKNTGASYEVIGISKDGITYSTTAEGTYGTFSVSENDVVYTPTKVVDGVETIYYQMSIKSGDVTTKLVDTVTIAPASNVLYEEDKFTVSGDSGLKWNPVGTTATAKQTSSTENDIYGFDSNTEGYNKSSLYSNGSALAVTVDNEDKRSQNITFTFEGTGFDLNSACGDNTGVMVVSLRDNEAVNTEGKTVPKVIKSYIVDTYYGDYDDEGASRYGSTLYQVPIISETALSHSNYTIQIVASYLPSMSGALNTNSVDTQTLDNGMTANIAEYANSEALREALADIGMEYVLDAEDVSVVWFDEDSVLNGGEGANTAEDDMLETQSTVTSLLNVVDSVRVYNPLENGDEYYIPSERNANYYNVIDNLINVKEGNIITGSGFAYISGKDKETISFDTYNKVGPKDELYLTSGTGAVTFSISGFNSETTKVMISLRAATGTPYAKFGDKDFAVNSNTEMYYDITGYVVNGTVTIQNKTPGTLLSVGSVKITNTVDQTALLSSEFDLATASFMMMAPSSTVEPNVPDEPVIPEVPVEPEDPTVPEETTKPSEPEETTKPSEPESTTNPTVPEETTKPSEPEETTKPSEPESTTKPSEPEETTDSTEPEDTTDSTNPEDTTDPEDSEDPEEPVECWFIRMINWIIDMFKKIIFTVKNILGF